MNLNDLHTPQPLRDADFAAIRARVKAEIAQREERPWLALLLRFAFAASLLVIVVPHVTDRVPHVPVEVARRVEPPTSERRLPAGRTAGIPAGRLEGGGPAGRMPALRKSPEPPVDQAVASRIEIITADPTIRIIWITPKESS